MLTSVFYEQPMMFLYEQTTLITLQTLFRSSQPSLYKRVWGHVCRCRPAWCVQDAASMCVQHQGRWEVPMTQVSTVKNTCVNSNSFLLALPQKPFTEEVGTKRKETKKAGRRKQYVRRYKGNRPFTVSWLHPYGRLSQHTLYCGSAYQGLKPCSAAYCLWVFRQASWLLWTLLSSSMKWDPKRTAHKEQSRHLGSSLSGLESLPCSKENFVLVLPTVRYLSSWYGIC